MALTHHGYVGYLNLLLNFRGINLYMLNLYMAHGPKTSWLCGVSKSMLNFRGVGPQLKHQDQLNWLIKGSSGIRHSLFCKDSCKVGPY